MKGTSPRRVRRGDIYYITVPYHTGHETKKDRPGIIVSCNDLNKEDLIAVVVFCSSSCRNEKPEHVAVHTTPKPSTAMCEHIYTIDRSRIGTYLGRASKAEMRAIDVAMMSGLGIADYDLASLQEAVRQEVRDERRVEETEAAVELAKAQAERDTYKTMYEGLVKVFGGKRRKT